MLTEVMINHGDFGEIPLNFSRNPSPGGVLDGRWAFVGDGSWHGYKSKPATTRRMVHQCWGPLSHSWMLDGYSPTYGTLW